MKGIELFFKECKKILCSRVYLLVMVCVGGFFLINFGNVSFPEKPVEGKDVYSMQMGSQTPELMNFENAKQLYEQFTVEQKVSGAYAEPFTEQMFYVMMIASLLVSFFYGMKKGRDGTALFLLLILPVVLMSLIPLGECSIYGDRMGIQIDNFAYIKSIFVWIAPMVAVITATGMILGTMAAPEDGRILSSDLF